MRPRHGSEFDLRTGKPLSLATKPVPIYEVAIEDGVTSCGGIVTTALDVRGLSAAVEGKQILEGLDLVVPFGEVHALMGPNGSGSPPCATC